MTNSLQLREKWDTDMSHPNDRTVFVEHYPLFILTSVWTEDGKLQEYYVAEW